MDIKNLNTVNRFFRLIRNNPVWLEKGYRIIKKGYKYYVVDTTPKTNREKKIKPKYLKRESISTQHITYVIKSKRPTYSNLVNKKLSHF